MQSISSKGCAKKPSVLKTLFSWSSIALLIFAGACSGARLNQAPQVEYWIDDRVDVFELSGENLEDADSAVALIDEQYVRDNQHGYSALLTVKFSAAYNLCLYERFREQPTVSFCSGVLVAPDMIVTAAHCLTGKNLANIRFVFGYRMSDAATAQTVFPTSEIYHGVEVIAWQLDDSGADWALIRLDRMVVNHRISHIRQDGKISGGQAVHIIGHPLGLPAKFSSGFVEENQYRAFFTADIASYSGNSGSPVFNTTTHELEGILVRGRDDEFVKEGDCWISRGDGGVSTRATEFVRFLAWLQGGNHNAA
jgi:hypothetical protein